MQTLHFTLTVQKMEIFFFVSLRAEVFVRIRTKHWANDLFQLKLRVFHHVS